LITIVWLFSRNFLPWIFFPEARTGMRVKIRELRRSLALVVVSVMALSIVPSAPVPVNEMSSPRV
jgi:hypothetical protein